MLGADILLRNYYLDDAGVVAQVKEYDPAVVMSPLYPAYNLHIRPDLGVGPDRVRNRYSCH